MFLMVKLKSVNHNINASNDWKNTAMESGFLVLYSDKHRLSQTLPFAFTSSRMNLDSKDMILLLQHFLYFLSKAHFSPLELYMY